MNMCESLLQSPYPLILNVIPLSMGSWNGFSLLIITAPFFLSSKIEPNTKYIYFPKI